MLNNDGYIKRFDTDDALGTAAGQPEQLTYNFDIKANVNFSKINSIVAAGMGGSALAAQLVRTWQSDRLKVPFIIVKDYNLPAFVDEKTLVICSSYSGNTEETLSAYRQALQKKARIVIMAADGELVKLAAVGGQPLYKLPTGYQPRMAVWYGARALAQLLESLGVIDGAVAELEQAAVLLRQAAADWDSRQATTGNRAKQLAEAMLGKAVWIYAGPALDSAAYKWKIDINENAKQVASWGELPEFNHNEFIGWSEAPRQKPFVIIELMSGFDGPRIIKRFEVSNRLLSGRMPHPIIIEAEGKTRIEHLLWACLLGDFASIYLGVLNGVNPSRVDLIEKLKEELG